MADIHVSGAGALYLALLFVGVWTGTALPGGLPVAIVAFRAATRWRWLRALGGWLAGTALTWGVWLVGYELLDLLFNSAPPVLGILGYVPAWLVAWAIHRRTVARRMVGTPG